MAWPDQGVDSPGLMNSADKLAEEAKELEEDAEELGNFPEYVLEFSDLCSAVAAAKLENCAVAPLLFLIGRDLRTK